MQINATTRRRTDKVKRTPMALNRQTRKRI
jgi:hypothetical protein